MCTSSQWWHSSPRRQTGTPTCPSHPLRGPYPLGNEYHSIADGDAGKPIMWRIKIQEGKDRAKDETGKWAFLSAFEGRNSTTGRKYTKTSSLMCEITVPIHGTGKIVTMDSGFCVTAGILHLHDLGLFGQSLTKKRKYWPTGCTWRFY